MVMADASGAIAMVECNAVAVRGLPSRTADWFGHANHARTPG
jgi:hypothetical protein